LIRKAIRGPFSWVETDVDKGVGVTVVVGRVVGGRVGANGEGVDTAVCVENSFVLVKTISEGLLPSTATNGAGVLVAICTGLGEQLVHKQRMGMKK